MKIQIVKNKLLRAVAIAMSAMVVTTSVPVASFAAEGDENPVVEEENDILVGVSNYIETIDNEIIPEVNDKLDSAETAVSNISESAGEEAAKSINDNIEEGAKLVGDTSKELKEAVNDIGDVLTAEGNVEKAEKNAAEEIKKSGEQLEVFDKKEKASADSADGAIADANIANTSNSKDEAYSAKSKAQSELSEAESGLSAAQKAYTDASNAAQKAQDEYDKAVNEQKKAEEKLVEAKNDLNNAKTNATAANEKLKAAQAKMDQLNNKVTKLAESKDELNNLRDQYYRMMVKYYNDKGIQCAVYNTDGSLNIEDSAAKAAAKDEKIVTDSKGENSLKTKDADTLKVARELMRDLIMYKLTADGVDPDTITIAAKEPGFTSNQKSAEGVLGKEDGKDKVSVPSNSDKDMFWDYRQGMDGRLHNVKVTYIKVVNGKEEPVTEYYNYVFKTSKYEKDYEEGMSFEKDFENGPIYVALIDAKNKTVTRDTSENDLDDYNKLNERLQEAIKADKVIKEYNDAKAAVDEAQSAVDSLEGSLAELMLFDREYDSSKLEELSSALAQAKKDLEAAKAKKDALETKVAEARRIVESIDLSRFDTNDDGDDTPGEGAGTPGTTNLPAIPAGNPAGAATANTVGVLGVRADAGDQAADNAAIVNVADNKVALDATPDGSKKAATEDSKKGVKIANSETPLAATPFEEGMNPNYLWLLLVAAAIIAGVVAYERHKKKVEANANATRN